MNVTIRVPLDVPTHLIRYKDGMYSIIAYDTLTKCITEDDPKYVEELADKIPEFHKYVSSELKQMDNIPNKLFDYFLERSQYYVESLVFYSAEYNTDQFKRILYSDTQLRI